MCVTPDNAATTWITPDATFARIAGPTKPALLALVSFVLVQVCVLEEGEDLHHLLGDGVQPA